MKVLMYPHAMEIGGSQLNAIELAGAIRDLGHEVAVYSEPGPLVEKVTGLGLRHIVRRHSRLRPGPTTAHDLRRLVVDEGFEVIHGWEWPPILEGYAAVGPTWRGAVVGSVMSMSVAPFIPGGLTLTVGTDRILAARQPRHHGRLVLLEPPVDTDANAPGVGADTPVPGLEPAPEVTTIVIVSRLVTELKLEGILTTIRAVGRLARSHPVRLVIAGDGAARDIVEAAAHEVNAALPEQAVLLLGELSDPRPAYASADICIGTGGSALRAMAYAAPLVVVGEHGFFETLTSDSAAWFLDNGWYGVADRTSEEAEDHLVSLLESLLARPQDWAALGRLGRDLVVDRYSLRAAAVAMTATYEEALANPPSRGVWWSDGLRSGSQLLGYKLVRRYQKVRGTRRPDDFNSKPN